MGSPRGVIFTCSGKAFHLALLVIFSVVWCQTNIHYAQRKGLVFFRIPGAT